MSKNLQTYLEVLQRESEVQIDTEVFPPPRDYRNPSSGYLRPIMEEYQNPPRYTELPLWTSWYRPVLEIDPATKEMIDNKLTDLLPQQWR